MRNSLFSVRNILRWTSSAALALAMGAGAILATPDAGYAQSGVTPPASKPDYSKLQRKDLVIFRNGNKVEGVVLEENETTLKMVVIVGNLRSEATYQKSEILEVRRDAFKADPAKDEKKSDAKTDDKKPDKTDEKKADPEAIDPNKLVDVNGKPIAPGTLKVYILPISGELGHDVSPTPMKAVVDEIVKVQPDIIIVRFDAATTRGMEHAKDDIGFETMQYDEMDKARELDTLLGDRIELGGEFKTKPRMVAWVNKATGGAAFFPFVFKEIYFTTDGKMGGLGALEAMFIGRGDEVVRQKQRSLRLGRAKGLAAKGGHDERIMVAMSMADYILSYRIVGGKAEFLEDMPPSAEWFLLKDDGAVNKDHSDSMQDQVRSQGNDFLTLDARKAFDIGMSSGTVDTVEELLLKLGVSRNYAVVKNSAGRIFRQWANEVNKTENDVAKLIRDFRSVQVRPPGGYKERTAARSQRKNILRQISSVVDRYREAINPEKVGDVDNLLSQVNVTINRIETEQKLDRPD